MSKSSSDNWLLKKIKIIYKSSGNLIKMKNHPSESNAWQFLVKKTFNPQFSRFGTLRLGDKDLPLSVYRKINELYETSLDAKAVLLRYRSDLSTFVGVENNCITPLVASRKMPMVFYKREDLTSIKAYKIRGAIYQMSKILESSHSKNLRFVAASTGNHALGVIKASEILRVPRVTICIPETVTKFKQKKLEKRINELVEKGINAELMIKGDNFDQTNAIAKELVETEQDTYYIDPYNSHNAVAGQGTIGLELISQLENRFFDFETLDFDGEKLKKLKTVNIIVPIGGGGLICGIASAFKTAIQTHPRLKHIKPLITGIRLKDINSKHGDAIRVKTPGEHNAELINYLVDRIESVSDMDMQRGIDFILDDIGVRVEGASAGTLKPVFDNMVIPSEATAVICILSGGNIVLNQ